MTDWIGALSALVATVLGATAAWYAWRQWKLAREQIQPQVNVFIDVSETSAGSADLVVKNFGPTPARDVQFKFDPLLRRSGADAPYDVVEVPQMPYLAPGQEWRTWWDSGTSRVGSDLPDTYAGVVQYRGLKNKKRLHEFVLDFGAMKARLYSVSRS